VETNLKVGGYIDQAQIQAERFFDQADQFLQSVGQQASQAGSTVASKASRVWNCILRA
jgi:hypothetical protein